MTATNPALRRTTVMLERAGKKQKAPIWSRASQLLSSSSSGRVEVNLGRISRLADRGQVFFVPGKVLGTGTVEQKVVVGAFAFSATARSRIEAAGGTAMSVEQFLKKYPKGSGVRVVR